MKAKRTVDDNTLEVIDTETGEVKKVKLASHKQIAYIRALEQKANIEPRAYRSLTVWQAVKVIDRLKKKTSQGQML